MRLSISKVPGKCFILAAKLFSDMAASSTTVNRFEGVAGLEQRKNDLFYAAPLSSHPSSDLQGGVRVLVFFGGDVQSGSREMLSQPRNAVFEREYSLESVTR